MPYRRTLVRAIAVTALGAALASAAVGGSGLPGAGATVARKTVCTITVNSADEKEALRRHLPEDRFEFVELVEHGRADWLASACRQDVRCDVLVISGHYDGGNEFFSDRTEAREFLPVAELERAACGDGCPGVFSQLKEVYLFGCNTLNGEALRHASDDVARSLVRAGASRVEAERIGRTLSTRHGDSSRDRMRIIFKDVPVLYGFSSVAPLGPIAGGLLRRHLQSAGAAEVGTGRASGRLLAQFSAHAMVATSGITDRDPLASHRRDVCQFADDRVAPCGEAALRARTARTAGGRGRDVPRPARSAGRDGRRRRAHRPRGRGGARRDCRGRRRTRALSRFRPRCRGSGRACAPAGCRAPIRLAVGRASTAPMSCGRFDVRIVSGAATVADVDLACTQNADGRFDGVHADVGVGAADTPMARRDARRGARVPGRSRARVRGRPRTDEPRHRDRAHRTGVPAPSSARRRARTARADRRDRPDDGSGGASARVAVAGRPSAERPAEPRGTRRPVSGGGLVVGPDGHRGRAAARRVPDDRVARAGPHAARASAARNRRSRT